MGTALSSASAAFERSVLQTARQGEFSWLSQVHLALFRNLDLRGTHLTELAARARVTKQSMQELVDKAEALGVVERRPSPADRRVKIVAFTPSGLAMLEQFREGVAQAERCMAEALGEPFLAELRGRLRAYVASVEPPSGAGEDRNKGRNRAGRPAKAAPGAPAATSAPAKPLAKTRKAAAPGA